MDFDKIIEYSIEKSTKPSNICLEIEEYTKANIHGSHMLIGKLEASFLGFLIRSIKAKRVLEFGTFTGYSALAMAENLPDEGDLITLDINEKTVELAKSFWAKSIHGKKIKSILGPAIESLEKIEGHFDFVFIDADKKNNYHYLQKSLERLNPSGIIVIDNVLWGGRVVAELSENNDHRNTEIIKEMNTTIANREDLFVTFLPIRDGMYLIQKK